MMATWAVTNVPKSTSATSGEEGRLTHVLCHRHCKAVSKLFLLRAVCRREGKKIARGRHAGVGNDRTVGGLGAGGGLGSSTSIALPMDHGR